MKPEIRPLAPADREAFVAFVHALSEQARLYRFLQPLRELSPAAAAELTQADQLRRVVLVAIEGGRVVGEARYVTQEDGASAEFAIAVADDWQRQGVGARLLGALLAAARGAGLRSLRGEVLRTNVAMLRFVRRAGFRLSPCAGDARLAVAERELEPAALAA